MQRQDGRGLIEKFKYISRLQVNAGLVKEKLDALSLVPGSKILKYSDPRTKMFEIFGPPLKYFVLPC